MIDIAVAAGRLEPHDATELVNNVAVVLGAMPELDAAEVCRDAIAHRVLNFGLRPAIATEALAAELAAAWVTL